MQRNDPGLKDLKMASAKKTHIQFSKTHLMSLKLFKDKNIKQLNCSVQFLGSFIDNKIHLAESSSFYVSYKIRDVDSLKSETSTLSKDYSPIHITVQSLAK